MRQRIFIVLLLMLASLPVFAAQVNGFRVWADPVKTRAVLDLDRKTAYKLFTLDNPHRVVVDLEGSSIDIPVELDEEHAGIIKASGTDNRIKARFGWFLISMRAPN